MGPIWPLFNHILKNKTMYKVRQPHTTKLNINTAYHADPLEIKIRKIVENNEPITDAAAITYTERKDGVLPDYDIRTDRMEYALDAMDKASKSHIAKREERLKPKQEQEKNGGTDSSQATT